MFGRNGCAKGAASSCERTGRIAWLRAVTRKSLVAFLTFLLAFGSTPAQLWAEGAEGIAQTVENVAAQTGQTAGEVQEPAAGAVEQPTEPGEGAGESAAPGEGTDEAGETKEPESAREQEPAASSDAGQDKGDNAAAAGGTDGSQAPAENVAEQPVGQAATITASAQIIGTDAEGKPEIWATASGIELPEGSTAADLFAALVKKVGITADYKLFDDGYFRLDSITSPNDGRTLSYDMATDENWMLYVDGSVAWNTEAETAVASGNTVTWYYTTYGEALPDVTPSEPDQPEGNVVTASAQIIGADADGKPESWATASIELPEGSTAADLFAALVEQAGLTASYLLDDDGYFRLDSITSPNDGRTLEYDWMTDANWMLYVDGAVASGSEADTDLVDGATITWYYTTYGEPLPDLGPTEPDQPGDKTVSASIEIIGADAEGNPQRWTELSAIELPAKSTAADLSEALFKQVGITADFGESSWGWSLNTITSPFDDRVLGYDSATGKYWQLFVNGESASLGAGSIELKADDTISWVYSTYGQEKPEVGDIVVNPDAERPVWQPTWPGFATANKPTDAQTPTADAEGKWALDLDGRGSDPIYVGSYVYVASGNKLLQIDAATGKVAKSGTLQTSIDSTARMVYADGIIVVPLHGGRLQALTADALTTVWVTDELASDQQSLGTLTVRDGYVYAGTSNDSGSMGYLVCVSLADGSVRWSQESESGFYWAGSVAMGDYLVTGNDKGEVYAYDPATGKTVGTPLTLDSSIRMTLVSDGAYIYAISSQGVLYQLSVSKDGEVSVAKQVQFGKKSTSTPAIVNGKLVFGGTASNWKTALFVYDAATLTLEHEVTTLADGGDLPRGSSQSAPLVSVQGGAVYAYFTVNNTPGGVYRYKLGDNAAELIYTPAEDQQNYCMNSIIAGPDGTLYYVNDSGTLFAVGAAGSTIAPDPLTAVLSVSNTIKGSQSAQQQTFSYTVELRGEGSSKVTGTYGDLEFENGTASFTLTAGQTKHALGLPAGLSYVVTQEPVDGFASNQKAFEGVLTANGSFAADFVNTQVPGTALATLRIVGVDDPDAEAPVEENWVALTQVSFKTDSDTTAWDVFKAALDKAGYTYNAEDSEFGVYIKSITSPDGRTLENTAQAPYSYWSFLVNGKYASVGASSYYLKDGDTVELRYSVAGKTPLPEVEVDPDVVGPDWKSDWPGYATAGSATDAQTPAGAVKPSWVADDFDGYLSDPIVVNDRLYVTAGSTLYVKDAKTGKTLAAAQLAAATNSVARMVYTDGLVIVPLSGGRLQALTADKLVTKWVTEALAPVVIKGENGKDLTYDQQALTTLTVRDGYVYFGTAAADWNGTYGGWLACVNLSNGAVAWTRQNTETGYYWAGAASVGGYLVIGGDDGTLQALDPATGEVKGSCNLGAPIRSTVTAQGSTAYAVTTDGVLHRVTVGKDGSLALDGTADFGFSSTSTPTLADGKLIVGGTSDESYANAWGGMSHYGALFIIDAKTLKVERVIDSFASGKFAGDIKSAPLVSEQADGTYVYFTVNAEPGGVFRYKLGDDRAQLIYVPDEAHRNYSMSSIVCDADGVLYYVNDSGALFALAGAATGDDDLSWKGESGKDDGGDSGNTGNGGDSGQGSGSEVTTPADKTPTSGNPSGTVAPSSKPLTDAEKKAASDTTDGKTDGKKDKADAAEKDGDSAAAVSSSKRAAASQKNASGMPIAALAAGVIGVIGLIAAGAWMIASKRRGGSDAQ